MAILCFQTAFPGDLFLSIPLLRRIREWQPEEDLVLACRPGLGAFFLRHSLVDRVIEIDKRSGPGRKQSLAELKGTKWSWIFCPHESPRTALWMARIPSQNGRVGFHRWWNSFAFSFRVEKPSAYPDALRQLSLLAPLDSRVSALFAEEDFREFRNPFTRSGPLPLAMPVIPNWASMKLLQYQPVDRRIFFAPGSVWATKRWTENGYVELGRQLTEAGYRIHLVGSPPESELCTRIADQIPGAENSAGKTDLVGLVDLLATGSALVSGDCGAMHAASVSGLPTVAIFGPTTLDLGFRPWNNRAVVVQTDLECRPCGPHGAVKCPIGTHACMTSISAAQVETALKMLI